LRLAFDTEGDGPLVVLLHGFPQSRMTWRDSLPALSRAGFRVLAPDLRGYGDSPKPKGVNAYQASEVVADIAELIDEPAVVVGHDWGAVMAWYLAMARPELVRKLVILNVPHPAAIARELGRSTRQKLKLTYQLFFRLPALPELFMRLFGRVLLRRAGRITREEADAYARQWALTPMLNYYRAVPRSRGLLRRTLRKIEVPVLIIWSEHEPVFNAAAIEDLGAWVSDVRIERIAGAGHFVQHDARQRVNQLLIEFAK
jgi:pimeloyl-ACP methyl ester carboxylesterase